MKEEGGKDRWKKGRNGRMKEGKHNKRTNVFLKARK